MSWSLENAAKINHAALLRVVLWLFARAGIEPGAARVETLPRHVCGLIRKLLRTAESAARRLVYIEAQSISVTPRAPSPPPAKGAIPPRTSARAVVFSLLDPLPRLAELQAMPPRRRPDGAGPRIWFLGDPIPHTPAPRTQTPDDPIDAARVCGRLQALYAALQSVPKQARRLALWQAKRRLKRGTVGRLLPLRIGKPPGHRKRAIHPVDEILEACNGLARMAVRPPDP